MYLNVAVVAFGTRNEDTLELSRSFEKTKEGVPFSNHMNTITLL